jgi:hypothetical protein
MSSINKVDQIVAVIRQQLARAERQERGTPGRNAPAAPPAQAARPDVLAVLGQRIRAIDRDDPDRGRKAFRLFLESVLLAELGDSLLSDPQFYRLVDEVQRQMESDPRLSASIDEAIEGLLARSP